MPRGDKSKYKQECKADHIAGSYESRGVAQAESESDRGTVNKDDGAAKKSGSGRGKSAGRPEIRRAFVRKQVSYGEKKPPLPEGATPQKPPIPTRYEGRYFSLCRSLKIWRNGWRRRNQTKQRIPRNPEH